MFRFGLCPEAVHFAVTLALVARMTRASASGIVQDVPWDTLNCPLSDYAIFPGTTGCELDRPPSTAMAWPLT